MVMVITGHTVGVCTDYEDTTWIWLCLDDDSLGVDGGGSSFLMLVVLMLVVVQMMVKVHPCVGDTYVIDSIDSECTLWRWQCRD